MLEEKAKTYLSGEFDALKTNVERQVPEVETGLIAWAKAHRKAIALLVGGVVIGLLLKTCGIL